MKRTEFLNYSILACFLITFLRFQAEAQPEFIWAKQFAPGNNATSAPSDKGTGIVTDAEGNIYFVGKFYGKADFDPGQGTHYLQSAGASDAFVCKLNPLGELVWVKQISGINYQECNGISIDKNRNLYITGAMQGITRFSPSELIQPLGYQDAFVCKLNAAGELQWVKILGGQPGSMDNNIGMSVSADSEGNVYSVGLIYYSAGGIDLDPGPGMHYLSSAGDFDVYISKLDANGDFVWGKSIGGTGREYGKGISVDFSGNAYITGSFRNKPDFDPNSGIQQVQSKNNTDDAFLLKLDKDGNFVWVHTFGDNNSDAGNSICLDAEQNILVAGVFGGNVDFDPDTGSYILNGKSTTSFISKFKPDGQFVWARHFSGYNTAYGVCSDKRSNIYVTGEHSSTVNNPGDFDPGEGSYLFSNQYNSPDIYLVKLDSAGAFITAGSIGGQTSIAMNKGFAVASDKNENAFVTGQYIGNVTDFNPDPSPGATYYMPTANMDDEDIFVVALGTLGQVEADFQGSRQRICKDECISFTDKSIGAETWEWSFEGGIPGQSTQQTPGNICYPDTGSFDVRLIAGRAGQFDTLLLSDYIRVEEVNAEYSYDRSNYAFTFHANYDSIPGTHYFWDFGDGFSDSIRAPHHTFRTTGIFDVCLHVRVDSLCSDTSCLALELGTTGISPLHKGERSGWKYLHKQRYFECLTCTEPGYWIQVFDLTGRAVLAPVYLQNDGGRIHLPPGDELNNFLIYRIEGKDSRYSGKAFVHE